VNQTLKKVDRMSRKALPENEKRVVVYIQRKYIDEAKALGFNDIGSYIAHLKLLISQQKSSSETQPQGEAVPQSSEAVK